MSQFTIGKGLFYPHTNNHFYEFIFTIALIVSAFLSFAYPTYDEANWIEIGYIFRNAVMHLDWSSTYVNAMTNHPGISILWFSASVIGLQQLFGGDIFLWHRVCFFVVKIILLLWIVKWISTKIHPQVGFYYSLFILLNPYVFIGLRSTWLDQLSAFIFTGSVIAWITFLETHNRKWLLGTALFWGTALLTKIVSVLLLPILMVITLLYGSKKILNLVSVFETGVYALCMYFILFPAALLAPLDIPFRRLTMTTEVAIGGSGAAAVWFYPLLWLTFDVVLTVGIAFLVTRWHSNTNEAAFLSGIASLVYLTLLVIPGLVLSDEDPTAFFEDRYLTPILPLIGIFTFTVVWQKKQQYAYALLAASIILSLFKLSQLPYIHTIGTLL